MGITPLSFLTGRTITLRKSFEEEIKSKGGTSFTMKKRLINLLLVFAMVLTMIPVTAVAAPADEDTSVNLANPFTDVKETDWFYDAVQYARINGFFNGTSATTFEPNGTMTRGMFVTVLGRMAGVNPDDYKGETAFSDVPKDQYYAPYVQWAAQYGITVGTGDGKFSPDALINRAQLAALFVRYFEAFDVDYETGANITTTPADIDSVPDYAKDAVLKLWKQGLLNGDGTNFNPADNASRAQAATLCMRTDEAVEVWYSAPGVIGRDNRGSEGDEPSTPIIPTPTPDPTPDPGATTYSVRFYDGSRLIDTITAVEGEALKELPGTEKTSKASGVFAGWYADPGFTTPFYADAPVTGDTDVYAKYTELAGSELTVTSFAQMDLTESATFTVRGSGDTSAITLTPMDGSDPVELTITPISGGYTITAADGFNPGSSYELTIPEGLNFVGSTGETLPETIRTASFSIEKEEVQEIQMSNRTRFVQHDNPSALRAGSTVTVAGASVGDLICFYHTTNPELRDYTTSAYMDDPETWFKVASVDGSTVTLAELEDEDSEKMYDVPDNFPVVGDPTAVTGTLTLDADSDGYTLDTGIYAMMLTGDDSITPDLTYAKSKISVGDFVSIYASSAAVEDEADVYFGRITAYDAATGTITYVQSSAEEIETAVDLYVKPALTGDDLISEEAKAEIEQTVLAQVQDSGFAEEAAFMLADLATQTDGFRSMEGVQVLLTNENGEPLSDEEIALLNLGGSFELSDDIELTVEVITSGDQLHFEDEGSVQLAVGIDAQFEVDVEDDGKVAIDLSATFVQELAIGVSANGSLVMKKILGFIPVPTGVKVGATVDLFSYTGVRVDVQAYTVAAEDKSLFDQFEEVINNPEKLADVLPAGSGFDGIKEGLKTVGDVFDKIEELEKQIEQLETDVATIEGYLDDLWLMVDAMDVAVNGEKLDRAAWAELGETFGKTNVSADLMEMLNLSTETELDADRYAEGLEDLLEKYSEMLEKETDWVTLVEKEISRAEMSFYGLVIFVQADFLVHADMNIAMGANLQYEVGKRYNFWIKVGLFKPEAGSSTMDLVDEQFAFQFYVMGKLGLKMGVKGTAGFAIGSADVAQVALSLEIGPYVKLYGFFIYEYERTRAANTTEWVSDERMAGALYLDFGLYLVASIKAEALTLFEVSYDFVDKEFPLLEAGEKKYPYGFYYEPAEDELVLVQDVDGNSTNGITMTLPDEYRAVSYCNLVTGNMGVTVFDWDNYNVYLSNPAFSFDGNGGISVTVPEDTRYMECDMVLTYKYGKLAFSTYDMQVTVPLVWTNLSTDEISQYYTASVRVGNAADGYDTVWSQKVRKNEEFTLPTEAELKELIGYNDAIYSSFVGSDMLGQTTSIIANTSYDCTVAYTQYSITVTGVQNADGSTTTHTYYTTYGDTFDFSDLVDTGTEKENTTYTKFANVTTEATVTANGQTQAIDLNQPITGAVAEAVRSGISATANYVDDSVLVTYVFSGIKADSVTERIRKGSLPTYDIYTVAAEQGMAVKSVTPELGAVNSTTTYYVECGEIVGESYTLYFEENGGNPVEDITRVGGSLIGTLPEPTREGYSFAGWYTDAALTTEFTAKLMPKADTTVYAKWTANEYTVNFNVNGGNSWTGDEGSKIVTYGEAYGTLPTPTRDGHAFIGWYTDTEYTTLVTADSIVNFTGTQTLYAKWHELVAIDQTFAYTPLESNPVYSKGVIVEITPTTWPTAPEGAPALEPSSFTFKFMRQGNNTYEDGYPVNAGTYDVTITRPADDYYAPFSQTITGVITIEKAVRQLGAVAICTYNPGMTWMNLQLDGDGGIYDLSNEATFTYQVVKKSGNGPDGHTSASADRDSLVAGLFPETEYYVTVKVTDDPNYTDAESTLEGASVVSTLSAPSGNWSDHADTDWYDSGSSEFTLTYASELAGLAKLVNDGNNFSGKTVKLGADIDLLAYQWTPIGNSSNSFQGTFDGQNHRVCGMYASSSKSGLFGNLRNAAIQNVTLEDSYVAGSGFTGGIVGYAITTDNRSVISNCVVEKTVTVYGTSSGDSNTGGIDTGGIAGGCYNEYTLTGCTNRGTVYGGSYVGGIVSYSNDAIIITNCVNYGPIHGTGSYIGGIAGYTYDECSVLNSANFGSVTGNDCVGGIVGKTQRKSTGGKYPNNVLNCYNVGTVYGNTYVGAIVGGRHTTNDAVHQCYYLQGCAKNSNGTVCKAVGINSTGSTDEQDNLQIAWFTSYNSQMTGTSAGDCGLTNLITALNNWVLYWNDSQCNAEWEKGPDGYPLPTGEINTNVGTKR